MFGKTEWFGEKNIGIGFLPISLKGWLYYLCWAIVLIGPASLLGVLNKWPELAIWIFCGLSFFLWDSLRIKKEAVRQRDFAKLYYIADSPQTEISTTHYQMHLKK